MNYYTNEDEGWKVNIAPKVDTIEEEEEETVERIRWSRKKKLQVLLGLIVLAVAICVGTIWYIKGRTSSDIDKFKSLIESGAYGYAYDKYIADDKDASKYSDFIKNYYEELVNSYNEIGDSSLSMLVERYDEVYGYEFDIDTSYYYTIMESKAYYEYGIMSYNENNMMEAYEYFLNVVEEDSNYESAGGYINKIRENTKNSKAIINILYTTEQEKLVAEKLSEIYYLNNNPEKALYTTVFEYKQVTEEELEKGLPKGEAGYIFHDSKSYNEYDMDTYGVSTEILVYNEDYFDDTDIDSLDSIISKELPVQNIYIPLGDGKIISGIFSAYNSYMYSEYYYEDDGEEHVDYYVELSRNSAKAFMEYVRQLKDNPNVYIEEDGIERFVNGEIAAMIIQSDEYIKIRDELGEGYYTATLPYMECEEATTLNKKSRIEGVNKRKCIEFVYSDDICNNALEKLGSYIYESELTNYLSQELGIYSEYVSMLYETEDNYINTVEEQVMNNSNNVDYYDVGIRERMDKLAAFNVKAASKEEVYEYVDNLEWLEY